MNQRLWIVLAASALGGAFGLGACGGDSLPSDAQSASSTSGEGTTTTTAVAGSSSTGGMGGAGGSGSASATGAGGGAPDCFTNPMIHVEIINACTTADEIDKMSTLPLLGPNGELPPLP